MTMPGKFYITNGCEFLGTDLKTVSSLKNAKRFTYNDGQSFLQKQLQVSPDWRLLRAARSSVGARLRTVTSSTGSALTCKA